MQQVIVLLSQEGDGHIPPVQEALLHLGCVVVPCNPAHFPEQIQVSAQLDSSSWGGTLIFQGQTIALESIHSIWWRRPQRPRVTKPYEPAVQKFLDQEAFAGFLGLLLTAPNASRPFWVSHPDAIHAAEFKLTQLAAAQQLGLRVPRSLLTNDPAEARAFYDTCQGQIICKPLWRGSLEAREDAPPDLPRFLFTNRVQHEHLALLDGVRTTAHFFQEYLEKVIEVRVIIIGTQVFAVEIHSQQAAKTHVDFRRSFPDLRYTVHQLEKDIEEKLLHLTRLFRLQYSSIDLLISPEGAYIYLEQNPNGQFLWLAQPTGLPLAEAMAHLLKEPEVYAL